MAVNATTGKSWQDSLNVFATDANAYNQELARVQNLISSGTAPDMAGAQNWLQQIQSVGGHHTNAPAPAPAPVQVTGNDSKAKNVTTGQSWQDSLNIFANDPVAYQQELDRVQRAIGTGAAPDVGKAMEWLGMLQGIQPSSPAPTSGSFNPNDYRTPALTPEDIAKMFGFDYSRGYAEQQAEALAQAKRNAYNQLDRQNTALNERNLALIEQGVYGALDGLDTERFLAQQATNQNQSLTGVNAGIASDQNTRLAMNAQQIMGDIHGKANLGRMDEQQRFTQEVLRITEGLALTEQEKLAYAEQLYNQRLQEAFNNTMTMNQYNQNWDIASMGSALQARGQDINIDQFNRDFGLRQDMFDWSKTVDESNLTGMFQGQPTTKEQQRLLENEWYLADQMGTITPALAQMYGIPEGMPTRQAREFAEQMNISWYNANTGRMGAQTSQADSEFRRLMSLWEATGQAPSGIQGVNPGTPWAQGGGGGGSEMDAYDMVRILSGMQDLSPEQRDFLMSQYPELSGLANTPLSNVQAYVAEAEQRYQVDFKKTNANTIKQVAGLMAGEKGWTPSQTQQAEEAMLAYWRGQGTPTSFTESLGLDTSSTSSFLDSLLDPDDEWKKLWSNYQNSGYAKFWDDLFSGGGGLNYNFNLPKPNMTPMNLNTDNYNVNLGGVWDNVKKYFGW